MFSGYADPEIDSHQHLHVLLSIPTKQTTKQCITDTAADNLANFQFSPHTGLSHFYCNKLKS